MFSLASALLELWSRDHMILQFSNVNFSIQITPYVSSLGVLFTTFTDTSIQQWHNVSIFYYIDFISINDCLKNTLSRH